MGLARRGCGTGYGFWDCWKEEWFQEHPEAHPAPMGGDGGDAVGLFTCAQQEGKARSTAETWDAQAGDEEKPFPQEDNPAAALSDLEGFTPTLASLVWTKVPLSYSNLISNY